MKRKVTLFLTGILLIVGISFPTDAEEMATEESIISDAIEQQEEMEVQGISWWATESVSQVADRSGRLDVRPLTKTEIANLYQNTKNSSTPLSYDIQPHVGAPYAAGRASAANRQSALNEVNMYRQIAGITPVMESAELSVEAQHGAVLLAAVNQLTHYPPQPADMDDAFYKIGCNATSSSNLSAGYGRMEYGVDGGMQDRYGSNLTSLGHRRWFLNPEMLYMGLGQAQSGSGYDKYYAYMVFDDSNENLDHDFVSWPSSGNFPIELISSKLPWSISLKRQRYASPSLEEITVEIINPAGDVEIFSAADNGDDLSGAEKYFNVNTGGYGEGPCIICNFGSNYSAYTQPGIYQIKVTGLKSKETGEPVTLEYQIHMFYAADYVGRTAVTEEQYNAIGQFVERLYALCLERASEKAGKLDWTMQLADHDNSGAGVGYGFVFSDEYMNKDKNDNDFLNMMYEVYLGRAADASGKEYWSNMLSHGVSRQYVFKGFAESEEYNKICGEYGIERGNVTLTEGRDQNPGATMFVYRLYDTALGREAELDGLNDWAGSIARGEKSAELVAQNFIHSVEFQDKEYNDEMYVQVLYLTFMGREYDDAGLQYWLGKLADGHSRDEVLAGFSGSEEFHQIMAEYGL